MLRSDIKLEANKMNSGIKQEDKNKIIRIIRAFVPDAKVYLFGSRARGDFNNSSDIDLAIDTGTELPRHQIGELNSVFIETRIPHSIDVLDLNGAISKEMKKSIQTEGILWEIES